MDKEVVFTKEMAKDYTILVPTMLPMHFKIIAQIFTTYGYKAELLENVGQNVVDSGLKYVHNDTCYPALLVIGQFIDALDSGKYDTHKVALLLSQTGGGCRASNYIHLLRKAMEKAGYPQVPVISLNISGLEKGSSFKLTLPMLVKMLCALCYGDLITLLKHQIEPYEIEKGASEKVVNKWTSIIASQLKKNRGWTFKAFEKNMREITADFAEIKRNITPKVKVGVVGEIYVKYSALANNDLE